MTVRYGMITEQYSQGRDSRTAYGIAAYAHGDNGSIADILLSVHDITSEREKMATLVHTCNQLELSVLHLWDVIDDFLAE